MSCLEGVGQLKTLTLGNNKIESIPEEIIKLVYLEIFDLSYNKITQYVIFYTLLFCYNAIFFQNNILCFTEFQNILA